MCALLTCVSLILFTGLITLTHLSLGKGIEGRGDAGRRFDIWGALFWRLASSFEVSGCGRTGKTRLSKDEILLLWFSKASLLFGGSELFVTDLEVEHRGDVEQVGRLIGWYLGWLGLVGN